MFHNLIFVGLSVLVAFSFPLGIEPAFYEPSVALWGVAAMLALSALTGALAARIGRIARASSASSNRTGSRLSILMNPPALARAFILLWFSLLVYVLNWPVYVQYTLGLHGVLFVERLVTLVPIVPALAISLATAYCADADRRREGMTFAGHLAFQARTFFGFALLPVLVILLAFDLVEAIPGVRELLQTYSSLNFVTSAILLLSAYAFAPLILRVAFRTSPLESWLRRKGLSGLPGQIRVPEPAQLQDNPGHDNVNTCEAAPLLPFADLSGRLDSLCTKMGMPGIRFLVWETGGARIANAGMVGLLGGFRFVLLSDVLFEMLSPEELETVVGHEIGHAKKRHLLMYFLGALIFMILAQFFFDSLDAVGAAPGVMFLFSIAAVLVFWKSMLGGLSRFFECQADLEGARAVGSPLPFMSALEKIAGAGRVERNAGSWLYRSVAARIAFVWSAFYVEGEEARFRAALGKVLSRFALLGAFAAVGLAWIVVDDIRSAPERLRSLRRVGLSYEHIRYASRFYKERDFENAAPHFAAAVSLVPHWPPYRLLLADSLREVGLVREAWQMWRSVAHDMPIHPLHRIWLREVEESLKATGPGAKGE